MSVFIYIVVAVVTIFYTRGLGLLNVTTGIYQIFLCSIVHNPNTNSLIILIYISISSRGLRSIQFGYIRSGLSIDIITISTRLNINKLIFVIGICFDSHTLDVDVLLVINTSYTLTLARCRSTGLHNSIGINIIFGAEVVQITSDIVRINVGI